MPPVELVVMEDASLASKCRRSDDAGNTHWTGGVLRNVENGCEGKEYCLVLQHDVKDYSVAAVRQLIEWGLANGYRFAPLDMTSPPAHHPLAN